MTWNTYVPQYQQLPYRFFSCLFPSSWLNSYVFQRWISKLPLYWSHIFFSSFAKRVPSSLNWSLLGVIFTDVNVFMICDLVCVIWITNIFISEKYRGAFVVSRYVLVCWVPCKATAHVVLGWRFLSKWSTVFFLSCLLLDHMLRIPCFLLSALIFLVYFVAVFTLNMFVNGYSVGIFFGSRLLWCDSCADVYVNDCSVGWHKVEEYSDGLSDPTAYPAVWFFIVLLFTLIPFWPILALNASSILNLCATNLNIVPCL